MDLWDQGLFQYLLLLHNKVFLEVLQYHRLPFVPLKKYHNLIQLGIYKQISHFKKTTPFMGGKMVSH